MVRKLSNTEMNLAGASLDALNAIDDILEGSTEEKTKAKASPSALYAYATDPNYAPVLAKSQPAKLKVVKSTFAPHMQTQISFMLLLKLPTQRERQVYYLFDSLMESPIVLRYLTSRITEPSSFSNGILLRHAV